MNHNFGEIDGIPVAVTNHALTRMVEMGLTPEQIRAIIVEPEETWVSKKYAPCISHRVGPHSLAIDKQNTGVYVVVTAMYASLIDWMQASLDGILPADRELRLDTGLRRSR